MMSIYKESVQILNLSSPNMGAKVELDGEPEVKEQTNKRGLNIKISIKSNLLRMVSTGTHAASIYRGDQGCSEIYEVIVFTFILSSK